MDDSTLGRSCARINSSSENLSVSSKVMLAEVSISFPMTPHKGASLIAAALHETAAAIIAIPVTLCPMNDCM